MNAVINTADEQVASNEEAGPPPIIPEPENPGGETPHNTPPTKVPASKETTSTENAETLPEQQEPPQGLESDQLITSKTPAMHQSTNPDGTNADNRIYNTMY